MKDQVYANPQQQLVDFVFDERVVAVFPDMIRRSVPGYELVVPMTGLLAANHLPDGGHAYDLGCSLGATTLAVLGQSGDRPIRITAVDNAPAMLERAAERFGREPRVTLLEADVLDLTLRPCDVVLSNWLLQFVPAADRAPLLKRIHQALAPEGILLLSEKIRHGDAEQQRFSEAVHHDFKRANGYSELEVSQKRQALENVMIPDTLEVHRQRLIDAGFSSVTVWFQCLNWVSMLARP